MADPHTQSLLGLPEGGPSRTVIVHNTATLRTISSIWRRNEILAGRNLLFPPLIPPVHFTNKDKCADSGQDPQFVCGSLFKDLTPEHIVVVDDSKYTKVTTEHPNLFVVTHLQFQNWVDTLHNRPIQQPIDIGAQAADGEAHEEPRKSKKRKTHTSNIYGRKFLPSEAIQSETGKIMATILNNHAKEQKRLDQLEDSKETCTELKLYAKVMSHALQYRDDGVVRYLEWASKEEQQAVRKYVETKCQHIDSTMRWQ
jgi:hypothetical protein